MKIKIVDGKVAIGSMFPVLWTGYVFGFGCFFLPIFLLIALISLFASASGSGAEALAVIPMVIMVPIILALQGVIVSGAVLLGLLVFGSFGKLEAEIVTTTQNEADVPDT